MEMVDAIGWAAGVLATICMLPQVLKSYRTQKTRDISWGYLYMLGIGVALWVVYGFMISSAPILVSNLVCEAFVLALAWLKARHG